MNKIFPWAVILSFAAACMLLSELPALKALAVSPLIIAVILGVVFGNTFKGAAQSLQNLGVLAVCTKQILRLGIIFYGFRITFADIASVGVGGVLMAVLIVFSVFFLGLFVGVFLGLDRQSAMLISSGSAICGAAAVLAANSVVKADGAKVAIAVCTVVVFGTIFMFAYPLLFRAGAFELGLREMGLYIGVSLHEVAHVAGAAAGVGDAASDVAIIVKMLRVLMLVPFLLMLGLLVRGGKRARVRDNVPYFALWFLGVVVFASVLPSDMRLVLSPFINLFDTFLLTTAMFALGCGIRKQMLKDAGVKPFILAFILAIWLMGFGYFLVKVLG